MAAVHDVPEALVHRRPDIDPALAATVETAMQRDPRARFDTAEDMARSIRASASATAAEAEMATIVETAAADQTSVLVGVPPSRPPVSAAFPLWVRRRGLVIVGALLAIALVAVLVATLAVGHDRGSVNTPATSDTTPTTTAPVVTEPPTTVAQIQIQIPAPTPGKGRKHRGGKG
jgi:serine/threonine-protein kinase